MKKMIKSAVRYTLHNLGYEITRRPDKFQLPTSKKKTYPPDFTQNSIRIIELVGSKTMTSQKRLNCLINSVEYLAENGIEGDVVECGVWKGGSMMAVAYALQKLSNTKRNLYLFDTYEGMSQPTDKDVAHFNVDAQTLLNSENETEREAYVCYAAIEEVKENLRSTNYPTGKLHFVKGKVEDTIPESAPNKIALLRLDTDWYESTRHELEHLFPRLVPGGVIIIDDYGYWKGCRQATDEYLKNYKVPLFLSRIDMTGRVGIKTSGLDQ